MKDNNNKKLEMGQTVAYTYWDSLQICTAVVIGFTPQRVKIKKNNGLILKKAPNNVLIIKTYDND